MSLHDYQELGVQQIRDYYNAGVKKVLLKLPTGGGKTHMFSHIMKATAQAGNECIMVVRGRKLVDQASKRLFREGVEHGVMMANHWNVNKLARVQVCSIDTLMSRGEWPKAKLVVIDEAHQGCSDGYHVLAAQYPDAFFLPVTATPYTDKPLRHLADVVVAPITMNELITRGYLVPPRYFAPSAPNMKGVRTVNGEYNNEQTHERMSTLTGDIVGHWIRIAEGRPTVAFAVNVEHSKEIVRQFIACGIPAAHVDAESSDAERDIRIKELECGAIKVLSNVGILCTGVDIPPLGAIISARPTQSYNLFIQQAGRGTRTHPGKNDFIYLDHAGNTLRHGFITEDREVSLDGRDTKPLGILKPKVCKECYAMFAGSVCPSCGTLVEKSGGGAGRTIDHDLSGVLKEIAPQIGGQTLLRFLTEKNDIARRRGYKKGWVFHQVVQEFGEDAANRLFPAKAKQNFGFIKRRKV